MIMYVRGVLDLQYYRYYFVPIVLSDIPYGLKLVFFQLVLKMMSTTRHRVPESASSQCSRYIARQSITLRALCYAALLSHNGLKGKLLASKLPKIIVKF